MCKDHGCNRRYFKICEYVGNEGFTSQWEKMDEFTGKKKYVMNWEAVSYLCYTVHLLLLGAITGGISYILNTVRSFCLENNRDFLKGRWICCILCILKITMLIFT